MKHLRSPAAAQAGAATLVVVTVLLLLMLAAALVASRNLLADQRAAVHQARHAQAFEAAEAGLQWTLARLNGGALDAQCRPTTGPPWREGLLAFDSANGRFTPATAGPVAACVHDGEGWRCSCSAASAAPPGDASAAGPAFIVHLQAATRPGQVRLAARGCAGRAQACIESGQGSDAHAEVSTLAALLPSLRSPPAAAFTSRGAVDLGGAALRFVNADAAAHGLTLQAGGAIGGIAAAQFLGVPGGTPADTWFGGDAALSALAPERFFVSVFGVDKSGFSRVPGVHRLACGGDCSAAVARAHAAGARMLWATGELRLQGPAQLGTPEQPLLLVAEGPVAFAGPVQLHGVVYSAAPRWALEAAPGAVVRGAVLAEGDVVAGAGSAGSFVYEAAIVSMLQRRIGALVAVPGGWSDMP